MLNDCGHSFENNPSKLIRLLNLTKQYPELTAIALFSVLVKVLFRKTPQTLKIPAQNRIV